MVQGNNKKTETGIYRIYSFVTLAVNCSLNEELI